MELMQAVEHYATAMKLAERYGNEYGDMDAANNAWHECKKAADRLNAAAREIEKNQDRIAAGHRLALELECLLLDTKDLPTVSRWWASGMEALDEWQRLFPYNGPRLGN